MSSRVDRIDWHSELEGSSIEHYYLLAGGDNDLVLVEREYSEDDLVGEFESFLFSASQVDIPVVPLDQNIFSVFDVEVPLPCTLQ